MEAITTEILDPTRNLKGFKLCDQPTPTSLKESNQLYALLWKRGFDFFTGVNKQPVSKANRYDIFAVDPSFSMAIDFIEVFKLAGKKEQLPENLKSVFQSNIGLLNYVNIFLPLLLLVELGATKLKEKALVNYKYDNDWEQNHFLLACAYALFAVFASQLMLFSILIQSWWTLTELLIAATVVTITSGIWYPIALCFTSKDETIRKNKAKRDTDAEEMEQSEKIQTRTVQRSTNMKKISLGFFNPIKSVEKKPIDTKQRISVETLKAVWWQEYYILRGVSVDTDTENLDVWGKFLCTDAYFQIIIGLADCWKNTKEIPESLEANIGLMHYINVFAIMSMLAFSACVKLNEYSASIKHEHPDLAGGLNVFSSLCYLFILIPLMVAGFVSQVLFSLVHAGLSALVASLTAPFHYISEIGRVYDPLIEDGEFSCGM